MSRNKGDQEEREIRVTLDGKEDSNEDSNTKFMRVLPEDWDLKTTIIRDNTSLDDVSLDEIY